MFDGLGLVVAGPEPGDGHVRAHRRAAIFGRSDLVTAAQDVLRRIDDAVARFEQALEAVRQIPSQGQDGVTIDGIEHELIPLIERLKSLREEVSGKGNGDE